MNQKRSLVVQILTLKFAVERSEAKLGAFAALRFHRVPFGAVAERLSGEVLRVLTNSTLDELALKTERLPLICSAAQNEGKRDSQRLGS